MALGEPLLRLRLRRFTGRVTVPVLFAEGGRIFADSFAVARFADEVGQGKPLFPAGVDATRWNDLSERILRAGRDLSVAKAIDDPAARDEAVPRLVPGPLRAMVGNSGLTFLKRKYGLAFDRAARLFTEPGLGTLMLTAIGNRDYVIVQAGLLLLVMIFITVNLLTDVAYGFLDPRIRLAGGRGR